MGGAGSKKSATEEALGPGALFLPLVLGKIVAFVQMHTHTLAAAECNFLIWPL
jgi:hypothetical protein